MLGVKPHKEKRNASAVAAAKGSEEGEGGDVGTNGESEAAADTEDEQNKNESFVTKEQQTQFRELFLEYFKGVSAHVVKEHEAGIINVSVFDSHGSD
jgi:hypothetical protein